MLYKCFLYFHLLLLVLANEAYTWDELAAAIRKAYREITEVYVLPKLINFTESIHPYLNDASKTPGWQELKKKVCLQEITDTFKADFSALTLLFALFRISGIHWFSLLSHLQKKCDIQWWNKSSWNCGMQAWCCKWELGRHNWSTWYVILENFIHYSMLTLDWLKCSLLCCLWQVLSSRSWKTPYNYLTMKIGGRNHLETLKIMLSLLCPMISSKNCTMVWMPPQKESGEHAR